MVTIIGIHSRILLTYLLIWENNMNNLEYFKLLPEIMSYEVNSAAPSTLTISPAVSRFIAKADTDSHVVKQAFEDRSGIPTQINP